MFVQISESSAFRFLQKAQEQQVTIEILLEQLSLSLGNAATGSASIPEKGLGSVRSSPWIDVAIERARKIPKHKEFTLGELLKDEWAQLPEQRVLGKMFRTRVEAEGIAKLTGRNILVKDISRMNGYIRL